jgi:hypothetical protein
MLPQVTPVFAVIKAAGAKVTGAKNEVPPPQTSIVVNESRAKGLNRDIDNLLDEPVNNTGQEIGEELFKPREASKRYTMIR